MGALAWAILLVVLGLGLAVLEVVFPSGGILGFLSFAAILGSIVVAFQQSAAAGAVMLGVALVGIPIVVVLGFKYWPYTRMGKRILLGVPKEEDIVPDTPRRRALKEVIGRIGTAKSKMLPAGAVSIDGRTIDAVSEGMAIEVGQRVRVVDVKGNRVLVRPIDEETPSEREPDPLARPIDSIIQDPFDEPPA
jgi:membrane-bound serine protease (ClpP class)